MVAISICNVTVTEDRLSKPLPSTQSLSGRSCELHHGSRKLAMVMSLYKVLANVLSKKIVANVGFSEH